MDSIRFGLLTGSLLHCYYIVILKLSKIWFVYKFYLLIHFNNTIICSNLQILSLVSDSCYKCENEDKSGHEIEQCIKDEKSDIAKILRGEVCYKHIVPDDKFTIKVII